MSGFFILKPPADKKVCAEVFKSKLLKNCPSIKSLIVSCTAGERKNKKSRSGAADKEIT